MKNKTRTLLFCSLQVVLLSLLLCGNTTAQIPDLQKLLQGRDTVRILVTDSGLGGYSVAAGIDSCLSANKYFKHAQIIFCNALPNSNFRYNELPDAQSKADVFSVVLSKMQKSFNPDVILIACNTLSVVYPITAFARTNTVPVIGVVELGVAAITDSLRSHPGSSTIILGTETTVQSGAHRELLLKKNIDDNRIITQACPNLESEIQVSPGSDMVSGLIEFYLEDISKPVNAEKKVFAALCCTHYGFSKALFQNKLNGLFKAATIINPNDEMIKLFSFPDFHHAGFGSTSIAVYSQAKFSEEEKSAIGALIAPVSQKAYKALEAYTQLEGIF
ncbi:MAG: aspartate/glutamate racemase family protein [Ignavibacteriales bacterium]|nr:aspartate/glutamate racemase family protein [Ignavibacteriales bacterium]